MSARLIAFYLPQYHPIPENDRWWGAGFTEWRNVTQARPLYPGHYQPHVPADLGYYDLRLPEVRAAQASLAATYGISGFCYYHYWFGGRRLLERPFAEVLATGEPDFPFCLCWANENWTRTWDGLEKQILLGQNYSAEDDLAHIRWLISAFTDRRYIRIDGKPLFLVYRARHLPDARATTDLWRQEAQRQGVGELYLACVEGHLKDRMDPRLLGFDAAIEFQPDWLLLDRKVLPSVGWHCRTAASHLGMFLAGNRVFDYGKVMRRMVDKSPAPYPRIPGLTPGWDNTARRRQKAMILHNSTPELYRQWLEAILARLRADPSIPPLVFVNAWNEWAEGNHLEPDLRHGMAYLEATRQALK